MEMLKVDKQEGGSSGFSKGSRASGTRSNRSGTSGDGTGSDARSGGKKADKTPKVDYSDPKNNVSIKFLKRHKAKGNSP